MPNTDGRWAADSPFPDMQIFVGASQFVDTSGNATLASAGAGLFSLNAAASKVCTFFADVTALLKRTGIIANAAFEQQQFGTAASVPGPSSVANTNGPEGISGFPPFLAAALPTLVGVSSGAPKKGMMVTSMDVIYTATGAALTTATCGLTDTNFVNAVAPNVVNRISLAANGLPTAIQATPYRTNVAVPAANQGFPVTADTESIANVNLTTQASGALVFYGVVLNLSYNLA